MSIRCKMVLEDVIGTNWGRKAFFRCSYDKSNPEDVDFTTLTPSGQAEFVLNNPRASEQLVIGQAYYVDFSPVPKKD